MDKISPSRKQIEGALNECKYELMVLTQDLGKVVPESELAQELQSKSNALQEKIESLEKELRESDHSEKKEQEESKKFVSPTGEVRIWASPKTQS